MPEPMYRRIADDLRHRIESGDIAAEQQLPTELELRAMYGASRNTVRDAIKLLTTRGLVETRPGQGTYVRTEITPFVSTLTEDPRTGRGDGAIYTAEVEAVGRTPRSSPPKVEIQHADSVIADALRIEEGATVVSRHQERLIDGTPWSLQTTYYPMSLVEQGASMLLEARDIESGIVAYLRGALGISQSGYRDSIAVRAADKKETAFFRLPPEGHVPVFEIHRVGFDERGTRVRLTVTVYPADRNRFRVNVGRLPEDAFMSGSTPGQAGTAQQGWHSG